MSCSDPVNVTGALRIIYTCSGVHVQIAGRFRPELSALDNKRPTYLYVVTCLSYICIIFILLFLFFIFLFFCMWGSGGGALAPLYRPAATVCKVAQG